MSKTQREIELKLEVFPADTAALSKPTLPEGFTAGKPSTQTLQSIYFDTPDHALRRRKMSLRVRKAGKSWVQTLKIGTGVNGGLSSPIEVEHPVRGRAIDLTAIDDAKAIRHLVEAVDGQTLSEVFETVMRRTKRDLTAPDGSLIEMALDQGEVRAGDRTTPLFELELELKEGAEANLLVAAKAVAGASPFRFSPFGKAERGYRLLSGEPVADLVPMGAGKLDIRADEPVERVFRAVLWSCYEQIAQNRLVILTSDDPEGPHQFRIGLRRLRSAFRLFSKALVPDCWRDLDAVARDLALAAGAVRDLDVLAEEIVAPLQADAPEGLSTASLLTHLGSLRKNARLGLEQALRAESVNGFLFDLAIFARSAAWLPEEAKAGGGPVSSYAEAALNRQWRKVAEFGKRIDELDIPERHDMRKALKKLRYGCEFFASLYPKSKRKPFLAHLRQLQEIFGYLNDVAMAEKLLGLPVPKGPGATSANQAAGFAIGWHKARSQSVWHEARKAWEDAATARRFWT
ncbi:CYTH and CHAD domain-containing protein [Roseibium suaedae]|uniref:Inorganic triphosphatase YgiF, contains CYTH and CHAD domains n=1 Tax=Roseibium suaedae TaxID=735517 RepID=A0A1M7N195_9HYPH|nr:CYTH and CHAD domain-containing protein [Roseibium suaedae]SHM96696.1 Inorganic triphosphatase YgiF, contains CYTH and CHAD domains [Roseibium suaedae]